MTWPRLKTANTKKKHFIRKILMKFGKIQPVFGLGMTPIFGVKNCQIKSLYASISKGAANTIFYNFGMVRPGFEPTTTAPKADEYVICLFVLLLYVPSQQLWSLRDGQFT